MSKICEYFQETRTRIEKEYNRQTKMFAKCSYATGSVQRDMFEVYSDVVSVDGRILFSNKTEERFID